MSRLKSSQNKHQLDVHEARILDASKQRSSFSWRSPFGPVYQLPQLTIFLIAMLAPEDVFQRYPLAARFASSVRGALLGIFDLADIKRFADSTDYPQVAWLVSSLHWVWLPIAFVISVLIFEYVHAQEEYVVWRFGRGDDGRVGWKDLKIVLSGLLLFPAALVILSMVAGDWSMVPGLTTNNRLGMGLLFWIGFWIAGVMLNATYILARAFFDINLRGK